MAGQQEHWDGVYRTKAPDSVSWYQAEPRPSLEALAAFHVDPDAALIDIGGGASSLVDRLLAASWRDLTVLDIAAPALDLAQARLGSTAGRVSWIVADITRWQPPRAYAVWHDRAVLHFLTEPEQQAAYRATLEAGTAPGALVLIATFALDGPERCSGLTVKRHDAASLAALVGPAFSLLRDWRETHVTPAGGQQAFQWAAFRRL